ncbi:MAG TPA: hypothetical protein VKS19_05965 [Verrucomicrobiae bacterium]|nr:hypothetical protein [Verrucomicrobiae bacterium]
MGITNQYLQRTSGRQSVIALTVISLVARLAFAGLTGNAAPQTNSPAAPSANSLPSKIMTTDGMVYKSVRLLKIAPDGLLVEYQPDAGGLGLTKLKFAKLPAPLQKQFGYDPLKASAFEQEQAQAMAELSQKMRQDQKDRTAVLEDMSQRPNLNGAVSVNSSDPTVTYAYYVPGQKPEEVGEYTAVTEPHFTCHADFTFHAQQSGPGQPVRLSVETVTISLGLACHIIEPAHPYEFVSRHEEGHRKITEYFYHFGPQVANRLGESIIDREFLTGATDADDARAQVLPQAKYLVEGEYMSRVYGPAMEANRYYDQLNDPEGVHVDVDQAVQQAIAKYANHVDLQSPIPAGPPRSFPPTAQSFQ